MVDTTSSKTPKYQPDPRILQARLAIARQLGLPPDDVTLSIGRAEPQPGEYHLASTGTTLPASEAGGTEDIVITIHKPGFDIEQDRIREEIRSSLAQMAPLNDVVQLVPEVVLASKLKADLQEATKGTGFKQELLNWPGFDPEIHKKGTIIPDHAIDNVRSNAYGVEFNLRFPSDDQPDQSAAMQKFAELTRGRIEAIKAIQLDRVLKYNNVNMTARGLNGEEISHVTTKAQAEGKTPEQIQQDLAAALVEKIRASEDKIRADFAKLNFNVVTHKNRLSVEIRSPEQEQAYKKANESAQGTWSDPSNADELRNTNPLTSLVVGLSTEPTPATDTKPEQSPQLHKVLARSVLFDKDKNPIPDFAKIAGRKDIQIAIAKEMIRILPQHPEREPQFREMLNSPLFKEHELWHGSELGKAGVAKPYPQFEKVKGENDTFTMSFAVPKSADPSKNKVKQLIEGLASFTTNTPAQAPVEPALATQQPLYVQQAPAMAPVPAAMTAAPVEQPPVYQPEATLQQAEQPAADDPYKGIARDIIRLHKSRMQQGWRESVQQGSSEQGQTSGVRGA